VEKADTRYCPTEFALANVAITFDYVSPLSCDFTPSNRSEFIDPQTDQTLREYLTKKDRMLFFTAAQNFHFLEYCFAGNRVLSEVDLPVLCGTLARGT